MQNCQHCKTNTANMSACIEGEYTLLCNVCAARYPDLSIAEKKVFIENFMGKKTFCHTDGNTVYWTNDRSGFFDMKHKSMPKRTIKVKKS